MFLKIIIFFVTVQQICRNVSCRECSDCQLITSCQPVLLLIQYKRNDETKNSLMRAVCGYDEDEQQYKVCCSDFSTKNIQNKSTMGAQDTEPALNKINDKTSLLPETCGEMDDYRIVGGNIAGLYEFPWMTLIAYKKTTGIDFQCSGSIINSRYILTAAHCIQDTIIGVRVGEYDTGNTEDCYQNMCQTHIQDILIDKTIVHENWDIKKRTNDIALIRVAKEIDLTPPNVQPICLPTYPNLQNKNLIGQRAIVSGWGNIETSEASSVLLKVNVPIVRCKTKSRTQICAGERYRDSCSGDSGGPLILEEIYGDTMRYVQFGIVSYGSQICRTHTPGTYTDVRKYVDWIFEKIEP
ncbi:venom protease-like [Zerene cesonia]|uniref:venom protease-like n=1 Tax=Zerene cesonia TaxID=33412 RepID=UPI0018E5A875|nr:venom protease-like [Zerene cesonia]